MNFNYKTIISIILSIALVLSVLVMAGVFEKGEIVLTKGSQTEEVEVYIVGEIKSPGIYSLKRGSILNDLVIQAGGLKETVDKESINLAFRIDKNMMIKVYESSAIDMPEDEGIGIYNEKLSSLMININKASIEELCMIPGVGEATAKAILEYKKENGNYVKIEDIMEVVGIKQAKFDYMKDFICVN